jgi:hypothetical protein
VVHDNAKDYMVSSRLGSKGFLSLKPATFASPSSSPRRFSFRRRKPFGADCRRRGEIAKTVAKTRSALHFHIHISSGLIAMRKTRVGKKDVAIFCNACNIAHDTYMHYNALFDGPMNHALFRQTAQLFFSDIRVVLAKHLVLQACQLTDPEQDGRGNKIYQ